MTKKKARKDVKLLEKPDLDKVHAVIEHAKGIPAAADWMGMSHNRLVALLKDDQPAVKIATYQRIQETYTELYGKTSMVEDRMRNGFGSLAAELNEKFGGVSIKQQLTAIDQKLDLLLRALT